MEGKAVLFKRFADVDSIDLEVDTEDADKFIDAVRYLGPSFGGINLEDIKAPECFIIEQRLRELMDIPVFHDDQHGTAIIAAAGLINALDLTGRDIKRHKLVVQRRRRGRHRLHRTAQGDGLHARQRHPLRHQGRDLPGPHRGHEPVEIGPCGGDRPAHAGRGDGGRGRLLRPLGEGRGDARRWSRSMAPNPIIFAMANPDPEITPEEVARRARRRHHGDRPLGLSQPGQQRPGLPLHLPRRARRARHDHQHGDEDRRRRGAGRRWRARTCPTRSPPPIRARARASAATTSSRCRSIRA